jgi:hypothetical protein
LSDCPSVIVLLLLALRTLGTVGANFHLSTPPKVLARLCTVGTSSSMDVVTDAGSSGLESATFLS